MSTANSKGFYRQLAFFLSTWLYSLAVYAIIRLCNINSIVHVNLNHIRQWNYCEKVDKTNLMKALWIMRRAVFCLLLALVFYVLIIDLILIFYFYAKS